MGWGRQYGERNERWEVEAMCEGVVRGKGYGMGREGGGGKNFI
jgi:hypothetical protein